MMTCATKELHDRDEKKKERNEQHDTGVGVRIE